MSDNVRSRIYPSEADYLRDKPIAESSGWFATDKRMTPYGLEVLYERQGGSGSAWKAIGIIAAVLIIGAAVVAFNRSRPNSTGQSVPDIPSRTVAPTLPGEMRWEAGGHTIVWGWITMGRCEYGDHCWGIYATPEDGCPSSLYIELALSDNSGTAVGFTNDVAGAVLPGQKARLTFESFDAAATRARVSNMSCY